MKRFYSFVQQVVVLSVILVVYAAQPANAQQIIRDDSYTDPEFVKFKLKLVEAVLNKDTSLLFSLVDSRVLVSDAVCGQIPVDCFKDLFRELPATINPVWTDLYTAVSYGFNKQQVKQNMPGYARKGEVVFQAPSYQSQLPENGKQLLVLGQMVNIRQSPNASASVIDRVSYAKLNYNDPITSPSLTAYNMVDGKLWYEVVLSDGRKGYIIQDFVSASLMREISIKKVDGSYKIISFYQRASPGC